MNTPAQCGVIKPPKTDIYSEAPHTTITAGQWHTCALRPDGEVACWGDAPGVTYDDPPPGPFTAISAGQWHTCALRLDGEVACWYGHR